MRSLFSLSLILCAYMMSSCAFAFPARTVSGQIPHETLNIDAVNVPKTLVKYNGEQAVLPAAENDQTMILAVISPDPAQSVPVTLKEVYIRFHSLPTIIQNDIYRFYNERDFKMAWIENNDLTNTAKSVRDALNQELYLTTPVSSKIFASHLSSTKTSDIVDYELRFTLNLLQKVEFIRNGLTNIGGVYGVSETNGYNPFSSYDVLKKFHADNAAAVLTSLLPPHADYIPLRHEVIKLQDFLKNNNIPHIQTDRTLKMGDSGDDIQALIQRLIISNDLPDGYNSNIFDSTVHNAVVEFQKRHGVNPDGSVGLQTKQELNRSVENLISTLLVNFERIRKTIPLHHNDYVRVNVPEFRLRYYNDADILLDMAVIVGRSERPTPIFSDNIRYIDFNPYWNVPHTLAVQDILPKVQKNPAYLTSQNIRVFRKGKEIPASSVAWKNVTPKTFIYTLRQDSGNHNALGTVKFMFPNKHSVYLHDTPAKNLFSQTLRSESSGCVRVSEPVKLANSLLRGMRTPAQIQAIFASQKNKAISLNNTVPVSLEYLTASSDGNGRIKYNKDIYDYDTELLKILRSQTDRLIGNPHP